jgi:drug/metabolite transporter (DMT)-like permease
VATAIQRAPSSLDRSHRPPQIWLFLAVGGVIFLWSLNYVIGKIGLREIPALAMGSFRVLGAGIASLPVLFFRREENGVAKASVRERSEAIHDISTLSDSALKLAWTVTYLGFFGVVLNQGGFTVGLDYTSISHSSLIIACAPILILLFSWFAGMEALTRRKAIGIALAFGGAAVIAIERGRGTGGASISGDLITALASMGLAIYTVMGKRAVMEHGPVRVALLMNIAAGALVLPVAVLQFRELGRTGQLARIGFEGWGALIYLILMASLLSRILYFWALRHMTPARLGSVSYLPPIGAMLLGFLLLGETITARAALAGVLVIAGVYAIETHPRKQEPEDDFA